MIPCYSGLLQSRGEKLATTPRLVRRGATFHYRMAVPKHLVSRIGRQELTGTLKTTDPLQAKVRCRELSNDIDRLLKDLPRMPHISQPEITARIRSYFQARLDKDAELVLDLPTDPMIDLNGRCCVTHA